MACISREAFEADLRACVGEGAMLVDEPMARHTTFKVGGPAEWLVAPCEECQIVRVVELCRDAGVALRVLGRGSNVLVADAGVRGVVLEIGRRFARIDVQGARIVAQAGASLAAVADAAFAQGLAGFEFARGIPGTIGGAAIMNAGAYGDEFKDVARSVRCLAPDGRVLDVSAEEAAWGYRRSMMGDRGYIVLAATIELREGDPVAIRGRMDDLARRRAEKQPLELPSAGSTFKRPEGHFAGKLIQDTGLRGYRVGGAQVSEKHAGFVVNRENATAADIRQVIADVQERVRDASGVTLEPEVRLWGFE